VYDITDRGTFNSVRSWMSQIADHADAQVNRVLIGNKCDHESARQVSTDEGTKLADEYGVKFFETSAKNDINVNECFTTIAREAKARIPTDNTSKQPLKPPAAKPAKAGCCK